MFQDSSKQDLGPEHDLHNMRVQHRDPSNSIYIETKSHKSVKQCIHAMHPNCSLWSDMPVM
jgi:hypothetical protein